jgi:hypothetical protein
MRNPANHAQGHFSLAASYGFDRDSTFRAWWLTLNTPRFIAVIFEHPAPHFDDSYSVNPVSLGPYGDAFLQELIPVFEKRYCVVREPWARWLTGRLDRWLGGAGAADLEVGRLRQYVSVLPRPPHLF